MKISAARLKISQFFASVKLAVFLIILISLFSLLAIVLEKYFPANFMGWEHYYQQRLGTARFDLLHFLGVFDPYHSFWFVFLLGLLVINVAVCTLKRTRSVVTVAFRPTFRNTPESIAKLKPAAEMTVAENTADTVAAISAVLHRNHYRISTAGSDAFFAAKGRWNRMGYLFFHFGLIILMLGGLAIAVWGDSVFLWGKQGDILQPAGAPFAVKIEKFEVQTTPKGVIRDFGATLAVMENDSVSFRRPVEVNSPLRYRGYTIYQHSYRVETMEAEALVFRFIHASSPADTTVRVKMGESIWLSEFRCEFEVLQYFPDFKMIGDSVFSASDELRNPAALYRLRFTDGAEILQWSFIRFPDTRLSDTMPFAVQFVNVRPQLYTGLQVSRKPGRSLIWAGIILMTIGLVLSFYVFHRRLWILVMAKNPTRTVVYIGGDSHKNKSAFYHEFDKIVCQLKERLR